MGRVDFKIAGATSRRLLEAARDADPPLQFSEFRVIAAVDSITTSWSKVADTVAISQVAELAGLHPDTTARILKRLSARADVPISYTPGNGKGKFSVVRVTCVPQRSTESPVARRPSSLTPPPSKVDRVPPSASTFPSSKVDSHTPKVDRVPPSDRDTEVDLPNKSLNPDAREKAPKQKQTRGDEAAGAYLAALDLSDEQLDAHARVAGIVEDICARDVAPVEAAELAVHCLKYLEPDELVAIIVRAEDLPERPEHPSAILALVQAEAERNDIFIPYLRLRRRRAS